MAPSGALAVHHEDSLKLRLGANRVELVELLAGGDDRDAAAGVGQEHSNLLAG